MDQTVTRGTAGVTSGETGFTLIELMIVVTILSLLTLSVSLGVNRPRSAQAQDWSRFVTLHARLREQAILSGEVIALSLTENGYRVQRRGATGWQEVGVARDWRGPVQVLQPFERGAPVLFSPAGQNGAVRLRFETEAGPQICESGGWEPVTCSGT